MVIVTLLLGGLSPTLAFAQDPDNGKVVWEEQVWQCQRCHGEEGQGVWARPLSNSTLTADEWIAQVRTPRRFMPHFSEEQVSDEQITDMHAYITSLPEPTSEFAPMDPGLAADAPEAQMLIAQKNCIACHGETGPVDNFIRQGKTPTAEGVIAQLRMPFMNMPSFTTDQVSDAEATIIADYLIEQVAAQAPADQDATQDAPAQLPQAGGETSPTLPLTVLLLGISLFVIGFLLRRLKVWPLRG
jgi:mono/diheme cytochrome c family protein